MQISLNRKTLLLSLLLLATGSACAEWEKVSTTAGSTFYVDRATLRKDGNLSRMWSIQDLNQRHKNGEMSRRSRFEYDCKGERYRTLSMSTHSEPGTGGKTLISLGEDPQGWSDIPPGSVSEVELKIACA
jgi:hypothetical protein